MDVPLKPIIDRVLMRRKIQKMIGSLYVPEASQETRPGVAEVVAKGPDCKRVKDGDVVLFGRYATVTINPVELKWYGIDMPETEEYEYLFCNEKDLIAIAVKSGAKEERNAA